METSIALTQLSPAPALGDLGDPWAWFRVSIWRSGSASVAVLPGEAATPEAISSEHERKALIELVRHFAVHGLSWTAGDCAKISLATEATAIRFLDALPAAKAPPKISPDGEGGLMLVWEAPGGPLLVTVDDLRLHTVISATTPNAEYLSDSAFNSPEIPRRILDAIPAR